MTPNPLAHRTPAASQRLKLKGALAAGIFGTVCVCSSVILAGTLLSGGGRASAQEGLAALAPLRQACFGGGGHAEAAPYPGGPGPHRLVVFRSNIAGSTDASTFYNRTADLPAEWQAGTLAEAELVACVHAGASVVEACAYTLSDGSNAVLQRSQLNATVALYAAQTGALLDQGVLLGAPPRACQDQEQFGEGVSTQAVYGEAVTAAQIQAWLAEHVE